MNIQKFSLYQFLFLTLLLSASQAGSIRGGITDEQGRPLSGVNITVQDQNIGTTSNQFGLFSLDNLQMGVYTIVFNYVGYKTREINVELDSDQTKIQNIVLIEEILKMDPLLVTAQKRTEQIQDVPITMSMIDDQFLQLNSQINLDILSGFVPGLNVNSYSNNRPNYVIRGLTSDAFLASAQPRVSVFYNNIPISRNTGALIELYDMNRIEILKGPQGTLFGRGAQIGAVHLISNKPGNYFQGEFSVEGGNYGQKIYNGMLNLPFTDNFYSRFAASYVQRDGFVNNTFDGQLNERKTAAFRSSFRYIHGDNTIMDLMIDYQEDHPGGTAFMSRTYPNQLGQIDVFGGVASFERGADLGLDRKILNLNFNIHHYFNSNLDLNTFLSYREHGADEIWDGDGSAAPALDFEEDVDVKQIVFESRLNFNLGHHFHGFAGISYWSEQVDQSVRFSPNEQSLFFLFFNPEGLVDEMGNPNFMPAIPPLPELGDLGGLPLPTEHVEESFQQARSEALESFIDGTFSISKKLHLTGGLRFILDRLSLDAQNRFIAGQPSTLGLLTGNFPNVLFATGEVSDIGDNFRSIVGRLLARYLFNENFSAYAGYARGRRPNVIQLRADAQAEILNDEKVNNYEIGLKGTLSDRLFFDAAAYYYNYNDFQTRGWRKGTRLWFRNRSEICHQFICSTLYELRLYSCPF
jgi:outer membrane receptor protein involved in Fe transport